MKTTLCTAGPSRAVGPVLEDAITTETQRLAIEGVTPVRRGNGKGVAASQRIANG